MTDRPPVSPDDLLAASGVRPTRQRRILAQLLFDGTAHHVDAQMLHAEVALAHEKMSLATVYNALRAFERAGLIRRVAVPSERVWFDTDTGAHRHFFIEHEGRVMDVPDGPEITPPTGYKVTRVDTVVHLKRVGEDE